MNPESRESAGLGAAPVCYRHKDRTTFLSCSQCGKPICADCSHDAAVGQRCPECTRSAGRTRVINAREAQRTTTPVVTTLIVISVVAYLLQLRSPSARFDFAQVNDLVRQGEWWRLITAAFLHGSVMHIGFNMYALYLFGPSLERRFGSIPFLTLYLASALAGGAAFLYTGDGAAVGASGAIFGLFGAWMGASYRVRKTPAGAAQFRNLLVLLSINLALPFLAPGLNIAWQAHVGGLVAGVLVIFAWLNMASGRKAELQRTLLAAAVAIVSLGLTLMA